MFDFRWITLFCLGSCILKHEMTTYAQNLGGMDPWATPWLRLWLMAATWKNEVTDCDATVLVLSSQKHAAIPGCVFRIHLSLSYFLVTVAGFLGAKRTWFHANAIRHSRYATAKCRFFSGTSSRACLSWRTARSATWWRRPGMVRRRRWKDAWWMITGFRSWAWAQGKPSPTVWT